MRPAMIAPSLTRCRGHIDRALTSLEQAEDLAREGTRMELVAAELRSGLDQIGAMVGAVYTEDLLDRIFSQFCIGK
jgi:tRNA modification GTPase